MFKCNEWKQVPTPIENLFLLCLNSVATAFAVAFLCIAIYFKLHGWLRTSLENSNRSFSTIGVIIKGLSANIVKKVI